MSFETVVTHIIDWDVKYRLAGRYYPATLEEPAEYPQVEILRVEPLDFDQYDYLVREGRLPEGYYESEELWDIIADKIAEYEPD